MMCTGRTSSSQEVDFRPCSSTPGDEMTKVIIFQAAMAIIGGDMLNIVTDLPSAIFLTGFAFWGVQIRKKTQLSLFEHRKQR